jgi:6-phosphofructokinase 1
MAVEVMGRHTGWIAVHAGIAGGADVILIPEIPWTFEGVARKVRERENSGRPFALIVVAEGARLPDGVLVAKATGAGGFGRVRLGGIGQLVADEVQRRMGRESRWVVLGHLQRGGPPTTSDRVLATRLGVHAVRMILDGRFGRMVSVRSPGISDVPLRDAINRLRRVPPDGDLVDAARALGISFGDR